MKFTALAKKGGLEFGEYNRAKFKQWLIDNDGARLQITNLTPESKKMRRFFEGGVVPLITFYQEGLDYRLHEDNLKVREWLKSEFNGEAVIVDGKSHIIPKSTKGELKDFMERVMDWMSENGYQIELLKPDDYKKWEEEVYPYEGADNYIDYLISIGRLKKWKN